MSQQKHQGEWKPDLIEDNIAFLRGVMFLIHAGGWAARLMLVVPGFIGRRAYGLDCFAGLMFAVPMCGQWITDSTDGRLFMRLWAGLWWLLVIHVVASHLLNRKYAIHSREVGARYWLPGGNWTVAAIASVAYFFIAPAMSGLGTLLTYSPACLVVSNWLVELKMRRPMDDAGDGMIEGRNFQQRMGG